MLHVISLLRYLPHNEETFYLKTCEIFLFYLLYFAKKLEGGLVLERMPYISYIKDCGSVLRSEPHPLSSSSGLMIFLEMLRNHPGTD